MPGAGQESIRGFTATDNGTVTPGQRSEGGSYTGRDRMGLFEFLHPRGKTTSALFVAQRGGYDVSLRAKVRGAVVATARAHRQDAGEVGVRKRALRPGADGIYGEAFRPPHSGKPRPAVLVFGGSEGGIGGAIDNASLLAAHGYPTLALAYFRAPGLPSRLERIPLEYFRDALRVLRKQPGVDPNHVLVFGGSRGGEAALLVGAHFPRLVHGVVAGSPSSIVVPGLPDRNRPAWTWHGRALPRDNDPDDTRGLGAPDAAIPVERIRGPVLLACGRLDKLWPSCASTAAITDRLAGHHFAYPVTALRYPNAGHMAGWMTAYTGTTRAAADKHGGTVRGNEHAMVDGYRKLLAFVAGR